MGRQEILERRLVGWQDALQAATDVIEGNYDARQPTDDITEIIARIITDLEILSIRNREDLNR